MSIAASPRGRARSETFALVTGGGTGGHVYPALAVAEVLVARGHPREAITFVGSQRGMEASVVPGAGFRIELLPGRGIRRSLRPRALVDNARTVIDTMRACARAFRIVRRLRPRVVVGVGGYASLPTIVAARTLRVPTVVHEQNAVPGVANRVAVALGARAAVSWSRTPLRGAVLVGNPVRPAVAQVQAAPASPPVVAVVGGSLGAKRVNRAAIGLGRRWRDRGDVVIHHVCGRRDYEECRAELAAWHRPEDALVYRLVPYEDHMEHLYADATVLVGRAGAMTVAELATVGVPSVLVPLPGAPGDHQTANARALVDVGGAVIVPDAELDDARLGQELDRLLDAPERLAAMRTAARTRALPGAAAALADLVERAAGARG